MLASKTDLHAFVAGLRIPEGRKALLETELLDHVESRIAKEVAAGTSAAEAEQIAFAALGDPRALRASLERIEPAFELDPLTTTVRGVAAAMATSILFAIIGIAIPHDRGFVPAMAIGAPAAIAGLVAMWLLAPRGIGAAMLAEARASIEPGLPATTRRRAVKGYAWGIVGVFHAIWFASFAGLPDAIRDNVLMPWGLLGLGFGPYALFVFRRARKERASARAIHGA